MTTQKLNQEAVELGYTHYFGRNEPNASWVHFTSALLQLPGLRMLYPMGVQKITVNGTFATDIANGFNLGYFSAGTLPQIMYMASATVTRLPPFLRFLAAQSAYLGYGIDDRQMDVIGTEASIGANEKGLTVAGWFKFTTIPASVFGLISKWEATLGNQRAYRLYKNATNNICFDVSRLGTVGTVFTATSSGTVTTDVWYWLAGRYDPSNKVSVFIDKIKTDSAGSPANLFNSTEPFEIGRTDRANYFDGDASNCYLAAAMHSDSIIKALWEQSRSMYGRGG